jgi:hypothetical protein
MNEIHHGTLLLMTVALLVLGAVVIVLLVDLGAQQSHIDSLYQHVNFLRSFDESLLNEFRLLVHSGIGAKQTV